MPPPAFSSFDTHDAPLLKSPTSCPPGATAKLLDLQKNQVAAPLKQRGCSHHHHHHRIYRVASVPPTRHESQVEAQQRFLDPPHPEQHGLNDDPDYHRETLLRRLGTWGSHSLRRLQSSSHRHHRRRFHCHRESDHHDAEESDFALYDHHCRHPPVHFPTYWTTHQEEGQLWARWLPPDVFFVVVPIVLDEALPLTFHL